MGGKKWCSFKGVIFASINSKENVHALKHTLPGSMKSLKMYHICGPLAAQADGKVVLLPGQSTSLS